MDAARKEADDRTALAEQKLASVGQLEEENTRLKSSLNEANKECSRWKKENLILGEKMESISRRRDNLESYLRSLAKKLFIKLEGAHFVSTDFLRRLGVCKLTYPWIVMQSFARTSRRRLGGLNLVWIQSILL